MRPILALGRAQPPVVPPNVVYSPCAQITRRGSSASLASQTSNIQRGASGTIAICLEIAVSNSDRFCFTTTDAAQFPVKSFALGFAGLLCAMIIGFVSVFRSPVQYSPDSGYDEALEAAPSSVFGANFVSNCFGDGADCRGAGGRYR
jgi:hypothetical protein